MTNVRQALADYLALRRSLGYKLDRDGKLLAQFLDWLDEQGKHTITLAATVDWVHLPAEPSTSWLRLRLQAVRGFAAYLRTLDPTVEVPPPDLVPGPVPRAVPYLYSDADIAALLAQADRLLNPLRRATMHTLIGLLAVTGMRRGEALALDEGDFDPARGLLVIRHAKFDKSRHIPVHASTTAALLAYRRTRDAFFPRPVSDALLVSTAGTRLLECNAGQAFAKFVRQAGLADKAQGRQPRPHDLRHSFAIRTLLQWYRDGHDVAARLPLLSTYLGHVAPANTYWYLHAAPELLAEAAHRLENATYGGELR